MTSKPNIEPPIAGVAPSATKRETLGMSREDWCRLGRCVLWCYLPMLILDSLPVFGVSMGFARSLTPIKFLSRCLPVFVALVFFIRRIGREYDGYRPIPRWTSWRRPRGKASGLHYLSLTFAALLLLYIPMHITASGLVWLGDYLIGKRAEPVIAATEKYFAAHGSLPQDVSALVPEYLSHLGHPYPDVAFARSRTINGYSPNYWYVMVEISDLPGFFFSSRRSLVYCSGGLDGIYSRRAVPYGPWMLCWDD